MKEKFYFPLIAHRVEEEYDDEYPISNHEILEYLDNVESELDEYQRFDNTSMVEIFNDENLIDTKLKSMLWGVCEIEGKAYGFVEVEMDKPLTPREIDTLTDWISGQNSDGLGESFEQRPIETDYGDMYVSMWSFDRDYQIKTQAEMDEMLNKYTINLVEPQDLRHMKGHEGLVLQGCGGSLAEWITGINGELAEQGILKNGTKFRSIYSFQNEGLTNIVFPMDDKVDLDVGKLAIWRIATHEQFGGTWLSDYVDNRLDGFIEDTPAERIKPDCPLIGQDGNIFNLMGIASRTLKQNGMADEAKEMCERVTQSSDYYAALGVIGEYVNITSIDEDIDEGMGGME